MKAQNESRAMLSVTLVVFISKALGFVREMVQANYFGTGVQSASYSIAYGIYFMPILLLTSCISSTMVPLFLDADKQGGRALADRFGSNCINLFTALSVAIAALMFAFAHPLVRVLNPMLDDERLNLTAQLLRIMMPSLIFVTISIVQATIMNARERYIAGQLSGFPYSIATIAASVCFSATIGIKAVAWATALSGIAQMLIVIPFQRGAFNYKPRPGIMDARIKRMIVLAAPSMLSMTVNELNHLVDRAFAGGLNKGDIPSMNFAFRLITFIVGVVVVPIVTVMFSRMSKRAADGDTTAISDILMQYVEVICLVLLPIMTLGIVYSLDIVKLIFMRGAFTLSDAQTTAWILSMYLVGIIFYGLRDLFNRGFHSLQNTRVPLYTSMLTVALNIVLIVILSRVMGAGGLALATAISSALGCTVLFMLLRKRLGRMHLRASAMEIGKMLIASLVCLGVGLVLNRLVPVSMNTIGLLLRLIVCGVPCLLVYAGMLILLRTRQLSFFTSLLKRG